MFPRSPPPLSLLIGATMSSQFIAAKVGKVLPGVSPMLLVRTSLSKKPSVNRPPPVPLHCSVAWLPDSGRSATLHFVPVNGGWSLGRSPTTPLCVFPSRNPRPEHSKEKTGSVPCAIHTVPSVGLPVSVTDWWSVAPIKNWPSILRTTSKPSRRNDIVDAPSRMQRGTNLCCDSRR